MAKLQKWLRKGWKPGAPARFEGVPMTIVRLENNFYGEVKVILDDYTYVYTDPLSTAKDPRLIGVPILDKRLKLV